MRWIVCAGLGAAMIASGCRPDYKRIADDRVQFDLLDRHEKREAVGFFEQRGRFFDIDGSTRVDHQVVLPLLKRLNEVAPTRQWALLRPDKQDWALALVIELPKNTQTVDRMAEAVQAADDKFSGLILQQWGHDWLMIDLIDQRSYEFLKKSNPNIDKQR